MKPTVVRHRSSSTELADEDQHLAEPDVDLSSVPAFQRFVADNAARVVSPPDARGAQLVGLHCLVPGR